MVGTAQTRTGEWHAFLWENGRMRDLGTLGGKESRANAINRRGEVVGAADTRGGHEHAFLWRNGVMHDLGTLPGYADSAANGINDKGHVVGWAGNPDARPTWVSRGFLWQSGRMRDVQQLVRPGNRGPHLISAADINNRGQIAVSAAGCGMLLDRGRLLHAPGIGLDDSAGALNERGQMVRSVFFEGTRSSGLDDGRQVLEPDPHLQYTGVWDVNDEGLMAGRIGAWEGDAAVFDGKSSINLDRLCGLSPRLHLEEATGINNRGQVVGTCSVRGHLLAHRGRRRAFLMELPGSPARP